MTAVTPSHAGDGTPFGNKFVLLIFLASLVTFGPALVLPFIQDDWPVIAYNPDLNLENLPYLAGQTYWGKALPLDDPWRPGHQLYRPLPVIMFAIEKAVFGLTPWAFRLTNLLLHFLSAWLVARLAAHWLGDSPQARRSAALAGILFAVHAIHFEPVAHIVGRAELGMTAATLAALLCAARVSSDSRWIIAALLSSVIATLFKEQGLLSPLVVLLYAKLGSKQWSKRDLLSYLAGSLLWAIVYLVLRNYAIQGYDPPSAGLPLAGYGFFQRSAIMATALVKYLLLFCFPTEPLLDYNHLLLTFPTSFFAFMPWLGLGIALAGLAVLVVGYLKGHLYAVMGVALVAIGLGPVSNVFLPIGTFIAERFLYLPSAGLCLLIAGCLGRRLGSRAVAALITSVLFCMVALCWRHIYYYSDPLRLASSMALHHADKPRLQHLAALTFEKFGKLEEAEQAWEQQRRLEPDNPMIDIYLTRLNIRTLMAVRRGQQSGSQSDLMNELRENLEHLKNLNDLGDAPLLRGTIYYLLEDFDQARLEYLSAVLIGIRSQSAKQEAARALLEMEELNLGSTRLSANLWQEITRISQGQDTD